MDSDECTLRGRLELRDPLRQIVEREIKRNDFKLLPVTFEHILIAQSIAKEAELVATDAAFRAHPCIPVRYFS